MSHILVVDDEPTICWSFREVLKDDGHEVTIASSAEEALDVAATCQPDAVLLDVRLPGQDGISSLEELRERTQQAPIIVMTAFGNLETAVRAVEAGAFDYLTKPFDLDQAINVVKRALLQSNPAASIDSAREQIKADGEVLIGTSAAIQAVFKQIALVASSDVPVLISGESGTGKKLVARAIHQHSGRETNPLITVCLPGRSESLQEAELFGMQASSSMKHNSHQLGLLGQAEGGSILLDEVTDLPPVIQAKLLRMIEESRFCPVGSNEFRAANIRVMAATKWRLPELIATGEFREDFFYRLSVVHIQLPPLRDRPEDIPQLAEVFLRQFHDRQRENKKAPDQTPTRFTPNALCELSSRFWAGNVRELRNCVEHAAIMTRGDVIDTAHLPAPTQTASISAESSSQLCDAVSQWAVEKLQPLDAANIEAVLYDDFLQTVEPALLKAVLDHCQNNRAAAARLLGLHRATLRQKLRSHNMNPGED